MNIKNYTIMNITSLSIKKLSSICLLFLSTSVCVLHGQTVPEIPPIEAQIKSDEHGDQCIVMGNDMNTATIAYEHHVPELPMTLWGTGFLENHNFITIKVSDDPDRNAMYIMNNGAAIIGTTDPCLKLYDDDTDLVVESDAVRDDGSSFWTTTSDEQLKTNIKSLSANVNDFKKLNFYNYEYKKTGIQRNGIMAQEMEKVMPQSVGKYWEADGTERLTFNPHDLFYWGLKVTQELAEKEAELSEKVEELSQENEELKSELDNIKDQMQTILDLLEQNNNNSGNGENIGNLRNSSNARLFQNRPNPLHKSTKIEYILPNDFRQAYISIHSLSGQLIANVELHDEEGKGQIQFDPSEYQLRAGTYYYTLFVDGAKVDSKKMVFIE